MDRRSVLALLGSSALIPAWAHAQTAPAVLRLVVPFTQGTGMDMVARTIGPALGERVGRAARACNRTKSSTALTTSDHAGDRRSHVCRLLSGHVQQALGIGDGLTPHLIEHLANSLGSLHEPLSFFPGFALFFEGTLNLF